MERLTEPDLRWSHRSHLLIQFPVCVQDFYVTSNGRLSPQEDPLQNGAVYHLEPRLCGGKGGQFQQINRLGKVFPVQSGFCLMSR